MKRIAVIALAIASTNLTACATVINGTNQAVDFMSDPDDARVELVNGLSCTTPCEFQMKRKDDSYVTFSKDGYYPVSIFMQSKLGGSTFGNILAGGIVGGVVDGTNGASNKLSPNPVYVRMVPIGSDDEPVLLDKDGTILMTVAAFNAKVAADVAHGLERQGIYPKGKALQRLKAEEEAALAEIEAEIAAKAAAEAEAEAKAAAAAAAAAEAEAKAAEAAAAEAEAEMEASDTSEDDEPAAVQTADSE